MSLLHQTATKDAVERLALGVGGVVYGWALAAARGLVGQVVPPRPFTCD